jgi:hypothetical protein
LNPKTGQWTKADLDTLGRTKVIHKSTQAEEINFALQEGKTIVGVMDTKRAMCFYIGNDAMESKDYEY